MASSNILKEKQIPEVTEPKKQVKKKTKTKFSVKVISFQRVIHSILDGTILTKKNLVKLLPFFLYVFLLAIIYIANTFQAQKKAIAISNLKKEISELNYEQISAQSKLMYLSRQTEVVKKIKTSGLKEATVPPYKIVLETKDSISF